MSASRQAAPAGFRPVLVGGEHDAASGTPAPSPRLLRDIAERAGRHDREGSFPHLRDVLCARVQTPQGDSVRLSAGRLALGL